MVHINQGHKHYICRYNNKTDRGGEVGIYIYIYIHTHTIFPHSTCTQIFIVISVYMGWGIDFAVHVNHYKRSSSMETKK